MIIPGEFIIEILSGVTYTHAVVEELLHSLKLTANLLHGLVDLTGEVHGITNHQIPVYF